MNYPNLIHNFLENSALNFPDKEAFFINDKWFTYLYIEKKANQIAHFLSSQGVNSGDRVAFFLENSVEWVITYYGILKAGAITVALNTQLTVENISYILADCAVKFLFSNKNLFRRIIAVLDSGLVSDFVIWTDPQKIKTRHNNRVNCHFLPESMESYSESPPQKKIIDLDIASIVYTSGSTAKPRGATLTHSNIVSNTRSIVEYLQITKKDRVLDILPLYYIYGLSLLNTHFFAGGSVVVDNRFLYPNVVLKTMKEQKVTGFSGVPSTFTTLLNRSNVRSIKFESLRYVTQAGGAMAPAVIKEVAKAFAPAKLFIMYGATEASARLSYLDPSHLEQKLGSVGKGIPNVDLFIADSKGKRLSEGQQGEIVARGSNIMLGYWNSPKETKRVLKNGLYYTGDFGIIDTDGFLFIVGRKNDMIKIAGNRTSAKEIEEALYEHPQVIEAAVIGIKDEILEEAPKAFVVVKNSKTIKVEKDELKKFLSNRIAPYKIPKYFEFCKSLPKNKSGKIQKLKLI